MSRLAHQANFANTTGKPTTAATGKDTALPDLNVERTETSPDVSTRPDAEIWAEGLSRLRKENAPTAEPELEQNEQLLHAAVASEETWLERQKEFEQLLEEKSDVIRGLHQRIRELQDGSAGLNMSRAEELAQFKKEPRRAAKSARRGREISEHAIAHHGNVPVARSGGPGPAA